MFSPDGRWLAYTSDESGRPEIYVQPYPGLARKWQISIEGGTEPLWGRNNNLLFFRNGDKVFAVNVTREPEFQAAKPRLRFTGKYVTSSQAYLPNYDVAPTGKRFLMIRESEQQPTTEVHVVLDWLAELTGAAR